MTDIFVFGPMGMQAFWIWLTFAVLLLGLEVVIGTQWLLWSAAAAGLVAVLCLTNLPFGLVTQVILFAALSLGGALMTRRLMQADGDGADVNDPHARMLGKEADVLSGFDAVTGGERTGRVMFDGVEWPAVLKSDMDTAVPGHHDRVVIERVHEGRLYIRPAEAVTMGRQT